MEKAGGKWANEAFLKNPYEVGKSILDPKCEVWLQCEKPSLDNLTLYRYNPVLALFVMSHYFF